MSGVNRGGGSGVVAKAHRPVNPWRSGGPAARRQGQRPAPVAYLPDIPIKLRKLTSLDLWQVTAKPTKITGGTQSVDIIADYKAGNYSIRPPVAAALDWVGRNHAKGEKPADNKTNFLYVDGHVELKHISETIPKDTSGSPWEWGKELYSVTPNNLDPTVP